ncbi:MAG TPA: DUF6364 family protein [Vicinamibacteria bacterium]|nr:DUF6364 family protein [Vicinamibacteria bacterium]
MKNLTLAIDEDILRAARKLALERNTTVNQLVRDYLASLANQNDQRRAARERILRIIKDKRVDVGDVTWGREELYER